LLVVARCHDTRLRERGGLYAEGRQLFDQCLKVPLRGSLERENLYLGKRFAR
jgi:hypothetical protein